MPLPDGLRRATINAQINQGEIMAHNIWFSKIPFGAGSYDLQDHCNTIRDAWKFMLAVNFNANNVRSFLHVTTKYTDVKLYEMDPATGKTGDLAQANFSIDNLGLSQSALPTEVAMAATLETGKPGRSFRGRVFMGGFSANILDAATGRAKPQATDVFSLALAQFMQKSRDQVNDIDAYRACVYSRKLQTTRPITRVSVGDVMDVQRRRRNALVESRLAGDVPA
jgi:hypothetical protein